MKYERLTKRFGDAVFDNCVNCDNDSNPMGCTEHCCYEVMKKRLAELEDKIEQKTLKEIPENAVVLTEERNKIICDRFAQLEKVQAELQELNAKYYNEAKDLRRELKRVRKETAEKFAERLKARFHKSREYYEVDTGTAWSNGHIGGLINDTIDEIAKEITEGKV